MADKPISTTAIPKVPWNPWLGVLFTVIIFYVGQVIAFLLISIYPASQHWTTGQATDWLNNSINGQFAYILVAETLTLAAIYGFLRYYKVGFAAIGFKKPRWRDLGFGLTAIPVYLVLYLLTVGVVSYFVPSLDIEQTQEIGFNNVQGAVPMIVTFISLAVLPPITEEVMVRGFLYGSLKKALPLMWAVITTSLLFASAHLPEGGAAGPLYIAALDTFILSLVLIYLREKTGSLWASITLHAAKNSIAFVALFVLHAR